MKMLAFLINTNLFISFAAVAFTMQAQIQLGLPPEFHPYLFIIFFATLFEYNLHRLITLAYHKNALKSPKHEWLRENRKAFYVLVILSVLGFLVSICFAKKEVLIALFPIACLTIFYTLPVYRIRQKLLRLREVPGLKIFMISSVWAAVTVLLPLIESGTQPDVGHTVMMITERFFFVFAITVPFDIRDIEADTHAGLKTIPVVYGEKASVSLAVLSIIIFMTVAGIHYASHDQWWQALAMVSSGIITGMTILSKRLQKFRYYHYGILDGAMILQPVLVALAFML